MSAVFLSWLYFTQSVVTNVNKSNDEPQQTLATVSTGNWAGKKGWHQGKTPGPVCWQCLGYILYGWERGETIHCVGLM